MTLSTGFEICLKISATFSQIPILVFSGKMPFFRERLELKNSFNEVRNLYTSLDFYNLIYGLFITLISFLFIEMFLEFFLKDKFNEDRKSVV